jgi:hypothetical protein
MKRPDLHPDRRYLILTCVLVAVGVGVGLGVGLVIRDGGRAPGTERGPCYGNGTCDTGLSCLSQLCVVSPGFSAPAPPSTVTSAAGAAAAAAVLAFGAGPDRSYQTLDVTLEVIENTLCACEEIYCLGDSINRFRTWVSASDRPALARMLKDSVRLAACTRRLYTPNRTIEAQLQLNKLGMNAKRAFVQMSQWPQGKVALTPAKPCCQEPDHHCRWTPSTWQDPVWKSLDFEVHESFMFQYSYESDGKTFIANAIGDPDCRGQTVRYTMTGTNENFYPAVRLQGPVP